MKDGKKIIVKQTRSVIGRDGEVRNTLKALGLGRIGKERQHTVNAALAGMLHRVGHLVKVYEIH
jgi:large subunit ribosomal protein L30